MSLFPFPLRLTTTLATAILGMVREDPHEFTRKVRERVRLANVPVISPALNRRAPKTAKLSAQHQLIKEGRLSDAVSYRGPGRSDFLAKRTQETLDQLVAPIEEGIRHAGIASGRQPRVLFFLNNSVPHTHSGYTERTHNLLTALRDQGVSVHAVTRLGYPLLVGKLPHRPIELIDGIPYERLIPGKYSPSYKRRETETIRQLVDAARRFHPDILHTTTDYHNAIVVSRAAHILDIPWIYEVRGELESTWLSRFPEGKQAQAVTSEFYQLAHAQETQAMRKASAVISLSEVSKKEMIKRGVDAAKIHVVPNAVDEKLIGKKYDQDKIRKALGLPHTTIIGTVTSVVGYEGLDDLIRATALLPDVTCLIVGDGAARPELEKLTKDLHLTDRVIFAGRQPSATIWKWYAALDVFVVPRKDTPVTCIVTPIKALIAQALGKPVVASDLPALREVTGNLATYSVPSSPQDLARALRLSAKVPISNQTDFAKSRTWSTIANAQNETIRSIILNRLSTHNET